MCMADFSRLERWEAHFAHDTFEMEGLNGGTDESIDLFATGFLYRSWRGILLRSFHARGLDISQTPNPKRIDNSQLGWSKGPEITNNSNRKHCYETGYMEK